MVGLLLLLLEYSQESFLCTQPNGGSLSSSPGWFLLHPLSPQDPTAAMQSAQLPWEAVVQVLLLGMLETSQDPVFSMDWTGIS